MTRGEGEKEKNFGQETYPEAGILFVVNTAPTKGVTVVGMAVGELR
jgi:hypothetical protein